MTTSLRKSVVAGMKWTTISQIGQQGIGFATTLVLARLLAPSDFGLLNMAMLAIGFVTLFRDLGTGSAVIQRQEVSTDLLSSLFWVNLAFGLLMTAVLIALAPLIGAFYNEPRVVPILRTLALAFLISCLSIIHQALLRRRLAFDRLARIELVTGTCGAVVGIGAALRGYGTWSLVYQALVTAALSTLLLWRCNPWRPRWLFRWAAVRSVAGYSLNQTGFNILNYFERNADNLLIGRYLGANDLGYYALAYRLMLRPMQYIYGILTRVMFPSYARIQDDDARFRRVFLQVTSAIAVVTFPAYLGLLAVSTPLILTGFGARWRPVIPLLLILAPVGLAQSVDTTSVIYAVKGRTDWQMRWGIVVGVMTTAAFALGLRWGVIGVAGGYAVCVAILTYPGFAIPYRLIGLRVGALGAALWRPFACSALMCAAVAGLGAILPGTVRPPLALAVLVPTGVLLYLAASWLLNREQVCNILKALGLWRVLARAGTLVRAGEPG